MAGIMIVNSKVGSLTNNITNQNAEHGIQVVDSDIGEVSGNQANGNGEAALKQLLDVLEDHRGQIAQQTRYQLEAAARQAMASDGQPKSAALQTMGDIAKGVTVGAIVEAIKAFVLLWASRP